MSKQIKQIRLGKQVLGHVVVEDDPWTLTVYTQMPLLRVQVFLIALALHDQNLEWITEAITDSPPPSLTLLDSQVTQGHLFTKTMRLEIS